MFRTALILMTLVGCQPQPEAPLVCTVADGSSPEFARDLGCPADFEALASDPLDASIPGARSCKTVLDRLDGDAQYFQNSGRYPMHWDFASEHLSAPDHPLVPALSQFNASEYFDPDRRFVLGAVTWYEGPGAWAWELSPYDTASPEMIAAAFRSVRDHAYFGADLYFHPTSLAIEAVAADLPADVPIITTDELFDGVDYQPLNLARAMGQLRFTSADEAEDASFREIVVLESIPNDIGVVAGIITDAFQTPLSHINVLSQNRGTPNMGLRNAWNSAVLKELDGKWVELTVDAFEWKIREVTAEEADIWWDAHRPTPIAIEMMDTSVTELTDVEDVLDLENLSLGEALAEAVGRFGGKGSHFGGLARIDAVPSPTAFVIPVHFFDAFMEDNGLWPVLEQMLADPSFRDDRAVRRQRLSELRDAIKAGAVDPAFEQTLLAKLDADFPGTRVRFRSSTNAEDIGSFNGAGLYTSKSGDPNDPEYPVFDAVRKVWASVYSDRAFDERSYYGIDHRNIGMALLVHRSFPDEDANGVAITANVFDRSGVEPSFYVNVQEGEESVVQPETGTTTDQFLYYYQQTGSPIVFLAHSNLVDDGQTVLTAEETHELGTALQAIHQYFQGVYGSSGGFYGMDVEFKFDSSDTGESVLFVKQARPYPGWGVVQ